MRVLQDWFYLQNYEKDLSELKEELHFFLLLELIHFQSNYKKEKQQYKTKNKTFLPLGFEPKPLERYVVIWSLHMSCLLIAARLR